MIHSGSIAGLAVAFELFLRQIVPLTRPEEKLAERGPDPGRTHRHQLRGDTFWETRPEPVRHYQRSPAWLRLFFCSR